MRRCRSPVPVAAALAIAMLMVACQRTGDEPDTGNVENGRLLLHQFDCGRCHRIPGVVAAQGTDGPPLDAIGRRVYLAGMLPNSRENMMRWIGDPKSIDPATRMPDLQVSAAHARDMVAYLSTLR